MTTLNYTQGQKQALWDSLTKQTSPMTQSEKALYNELIKEFGELVFEEGANYPTLIRKGNKVKFISLDTFGEDYRNCWLKIYTTSKGEYFTSTYVGKRIYLN